MTTAQILSDASMRPDLFHWNGKMNAENLQRWIGENPWVEGCPNELLAFWAETGGGDVFETESILGPMSNPALGDDLKATNEAMRSRGMRARYLVFHIGLITSAVDTTSGDYVELEPSDFQVVRRFPTLGDWYSMTLRQEYGSRYGLP